MHAAVTGMKHGLAVRQVVKELLGRPASMKLWQDNQVNAMALTSEKTSWRRRPYGIRASWIRDIIEVEMVDALTKFLKKT